MTLQLAADNAPQAVAADVARVGRIRAVPLILRILCESTGLGFAAVVRVTEDSWTACAVLDHIGFGLRPGGQLDVVTTFCHEVHSSREPILIEKASEDPAYCRHETPRRYGFESYIAVPIIRRDGRFFGTICALDPKPLPLAGTRILPSLRLFAELVAAEIESEERLDTSQSALTDANAVGALRDQFIAVLGHDLRNPLASVSAGVDVLSRRPREDAEAAVLERMEQSCRRMSGLIDDILDFARGRLGGGIPIERQAAAVLDGTLRQVVEELRGVHPERAVGMEMDLRAPVSCDPRRIGQLLSNLLGNALAHGAPEQPVRVVARSGPEGFRLSVSNGGAPIPPPIMAQLFEPFSRTGSGPRQEGLGLGLYIAAEIARAHGGTLGVSSTPAATTFTLDLPPENR